MRSSAPELPLLRIVPGGPPDGALSDDLAWEPHLDHDGRVCAYTRMLDNYGWLHLPGLARFRFSSDLTHVEAFPERDAPADAITASFYRIALPMALQVAGYEVLHASAVGNEKGVHVFCGASRSGKSTIAYALGRRAFEVWADDAVAFTADVEGIVATPLPFALRLRAEVADFLEVPTLMGQRANGKTETLRYQARGPREIASVSILERGPSSTITRLTGPESLPAVLYHSFYFSLDDPSVRRMSTQFLDLVAEVPVFRVSLRPGLEAMPSLLDELEERVLSPTSP